jgi:hypothetical protein
MPDTHDLARLGYQAYGAATGGLTHDGRRMPAWDHLGDTIQSAWAAAATAIHTAVTTSTVPLPPAPQVPSQGQSVLVLMDPARNNGCPTAPAVITRAWTGTSVNVKVLADSGDLPEADWRTSLTYVDDLTTVADDDPARLYRWTWPPRT